jgi:hypothetical protein
MSQPIDGLPPEEHRQADENRRIDERRDDLQAPEPV